MKSFLIVTIATLSFSFAQAQEQLGFDFGEAGLTGESKRAAIASGIAPGEYYSEAVERLSKDSNILERRAEAGRLFLEKTGGIQVLTGEALIEGMKSTAFYSSPFDVMTSSRLYTNVDLGIKLDITNSGRSGHSMLILEMVTDLEAPKETTELKFHEIIKEMRANGLDVSIKLGSLLSESRSHGSKVKTARQDIYIERAASAEAMAERMTKLLKSLPGVAAPKASKLDKLQNKKSKRVSRAAGQAVKAEKAGIDAKASARRAARK